MSMQAFLPAACINRLKNMIMLDDERGGIIKTHMKEGKCQMEVAKVINGTSADRSRARSGAKAVASVPVGNEIFSHRPLCHDNERKATIVFHTHPFAPSNLSERIYGHFAPPTPADFYVHGIYATIQREIQNPPLPPLNAVVVACEGIYTYGARPETVEKYRHDKNALENIKAILEPAFAEYATSVVNMKLLPISRIEPFSEEMRQYRIQKQISNNVYFTKLRDAGFWCQYYPIPRKKDVLINVYG